ncbi:heme o synthase [Salisediminibacterium beveridgei]|uniref:Protoheme IX farnesyltransferase n=1 Tax=Salisediminibacterium beveridgei TaxID=632773 RepID=A0A1D7QWB9_9BACI|nr:heme o synthase [Salisediminibacterium beveridgei]AOM83302.1 Heme O synthase, protoheme IX farnesyltransferase COX10-CtaB [Salisediminibacterium beveridgei]
MDKTGAAVSAERLNQNESTTTHVSWKEYLAISKTGIVTSNLMTVFAGLFLAAYYNGVSLTADPLTAVLTLLGAAMVIAGGCALNNYIDRDIDHIMERTKDRPSVTGVLSGRQTLTYGLVMAFGGVTLLAMTTITSAFIGLVGLFIYVVLYSMWTKRTTSFNTIVGSFSGAVPPLIGWAAIDPGLHPVAWTLFLIMFLWQPPHFLALAMRRRDEYAAAGIPMLPVVAGFAMTKRQIVWYVAALLPVSLIVVNFGAIYTVTAGVLGAGWLILGLTGFRTQNDVQWATKMFIYSLNYLTILFVVIILVHLF